MSLGITKLMGFLQISKDYPSQIEKSINTITSFLFTLARSFRGTFIAIIYLQKLKPYCKILRRFSEGTSSPIRPETTNVM